MPEQKSDHDLPGARGRCHLLFGRGNVGKSTHARWSVERALKQNRRLTVVDADRNNATLAAAFSFAVRSTDEADETMISFIEQQTGKLAENGGSMLIDLGGGDRIMAKIIEQHRFMDVMPEEGIEVVAWHFLAAGRDDIETMIWMEAADIRATRTVIVLNEGLVRPLAGGADPFADVLASKTLNEVLERGGRLVRMPGLKQSTMNRLDRLFIGYEAAAAGQLPVDEDGKPIPDIVPLGFWERKEVRRWLTAMEDRHAAAGVAAWLP